eukprot:9036599-Heterocapsa_arctica.AAC.1
MALCRHCGGKHLHRDCPQAPSSSGMAARPTPKAAPRPTPAQGKGKGKGKGKDKSKAQCNRCGKRGHQARDCWAVMALEDGGGPEGVNCMAE